MNTKYQKLKLIIETIVKQELNESVPRGRTIAGKNPKTEHVNNVDMDSWDVAKQIPTKVKTKLELQESANQRPVNRKINENYGNELDKLQILFDKVVESMRGSSILQDNGAIQVWVDFGLRNGFCDEFGNLRKKLN
jgi:hypothetical protein